MDKIINPNEWGAHGDRAFRGGQLIPLVENGRAVSLSEMNKVAALKLGEHIPESLERAMAEVRSNPPKDWSVYYNRAMGASDTYGPNNNGDAFSRYWLTRRHPTFVSNANLYRHHQARPGLEVGKVYESAYHDSLDTVDLLLGAPTSQLLDDEARARAAGGLIATSMGAAVPYDVCSICGHRAKTRLQYCDHARNSMLRLVDGRLVYVDNPMPTFRDISIVLIGADPISAMLAKVAAMKEAGKQATIQKEIVSPISPRPALPQDSMEQWVRIYPAEDLFTTLDKAVGPLRPDEFMSVVTGDCSCMSPSTVPMVRKTATRRLPIHGDMDLGLAMLAKRACLGEGVSIQSPYPMDDYYRDIYLGYRAARDPMEQEYLW